MFSLVSLFTFHKDIFSLCVCFFICASTNYSKVVFSGEKKNISTCWVLVIENSLLITQANRIHIQISQIIEKKTHCSITLNALMLFSHHGSFPISRRMCLCGNRRSVSLTGVSMWFWTAWTGTQSTRSKSWQKTSRADLSQASCTSEQLQSLLPSQVLIPIILCCTSTPERAH